MFEPYEKGLYHNVLEMSLNTTYPFVNDILKKHNITNQMRELTNSENIYYAVSDDFKSNVKLLNRYIQEHYDIVYVFYGTQIENEEKKNENKYHGKYSGFYCNIRNSEYNLKDLKLKIYVENQNGVYVVEP